MYVLGVTRVSRPQEISAWRPSVAGVVEVFHARFTEHAYPMHVHEAWTLLIVDDGAVRYDLDRHRHGTPDGTVSLLPPHVPHNGSPATPDGFRKRVLYLDLSRLDASLIGPAVDTPRPGRPAAARPRRPAAHRPRRPGRRAGGGEPPGVRRGAAARPSAARRGPGAPPAGPGRRAGPARAAGRAAAGGHHARRGRPAGPRAPDPPRTGLQRGLRHRAAPVRDGPSGRPRPPPAAGGRTAGGGGHRGRLPRPVPPHPALQADRRHHPGPLRRNSTAPRPSVRGPGHRVRSAVCGSTVRGQTSEPPGSSTFAPSFSSFSMKFS